LRDTSHPETIEYLRAEQAYYDQATHHLRPLREALTFEMTCRTPPADTSVGWSRHGLVYFTRARHGEEHERLYLLDQESGEEQLVLDPNQIAPGTGYLELGAVEPSPDGCVVAYTIDVTGEEVYELRFRDVATGQDLLDRVPGVAPDGAWSVDGSTFFYAVLDEAQRACQIRRHLLGTSVHDDAPVVIEQDARFELEVHAARDGRWVVISSESQDSSEVYLVSAVHPGEPARLVAPRRPGVEYSVEPLPGGWDGTGIDVLLIVTDDGAPEFRLVEAPIPPPAGDGDPSSWRPVGGLPNGGGERLESAAVFAGHVVLSLRRDCEPFLRIVDRPDPGHEPAPRPTTREVHPGIPYGQLRLWRAQDPDTTHIVVVEENLVTAPAWIDVDLSSGARSVIKRTQVPHLDPTRYLTDRIYATAPDGVRIPVTIARRRDVRRGRTTGCVMTGYGAYESCSWPTFGVSTMSLLDRGLVYAVAHVRGGGEQGRAWWRAARQRGKPRTFVDYIAARDALVAAGWAGEVRGGARVVSRGRSAGGLLQGAVFSRAPRMWRAVVAEVPFVDVVTTMSDPELPLTIAELGEWGDPAVSPEDFAAMLSWSPYDNPPPPGRPPLLVTGGLHDPRVLVHEPAKWVARLRATDDGQAPAPLLFRVELGEESHTGPSGRYGQLRYEAEILAWVLEQLDLRR
jgi:oligopeptidase B